MLSLLSFILVYIDYRFNSFSINIISNREIETYALKMDVLFLIQSVSFLTYCFDSYCSGKLTDPFRVTKVLLQFQRRIPALYLLSNYVYL